MRCKIGVHTGRIDVMFDPGTYEEVKGLLPAPVGRRSWYLAERAGSVFLRRSRFGTTAQRMILKGGPFVRINNDCNTIVRHATTEREAHHVEGLGEIEIVMPPHHEWPWITDARSRLTVTDMAKWRWHLVQELNARALSATRHHVDVPEPPEWVKQMLTRDEYLRHMSNQEVAS